MTDVLCSLSSQSEQDIKDLLNSKQKIYALILLCNKKTKEITTSQIIDTFDSSAAATIQEELPDSSPRFILVRHGVTLDSHYDQTCTSLIWFNPLDCDTIIKRMYMQSRDVVKKLLPKNLKEFELSSIEDFTEDWFSHKVIGITGKAKD